MIISDIYNMLKEKFPSADLVMVENHPDQIMAVKSEDLVDAATFLRDDENLAFNCLMCLTGMETPTDLQVVYNLFSMKYRHKFSFKCGGSKEGKVEIPSLSSVWHTAEWHEREAYDFFGMTFTNHPDHRRILLPDDWIGHPLRKDYVPQESWHGIPLTSLPTIQSEPAEEQA